jgi:putative zinc finger protein
MNVVNFNERACERYRRYFDAYLDNELLVETNQDVLQHLNTCPDCNHVLETRARMKQLVKEAVTKEEAPLELAMALRDRFRTERKSFFAFDTARWVMAAAAVVLLAIGSLAALQWGRVIAFNRDSAVFQTVSARVGNLLRVGLIDHVHCAIMSKQWKRLMSFEDMKANTGRTALGSEFIELVPAIRAKLGNDFKLVLGHRCTANHRRYVHLILTGKNDKILSLVITEKQDGESFTQAEAVAVIDAAGIPIYRDQQGIYEIAGFESAKYLAYVVSNLDRKSHLNIASVVAPVVHAHLHQLEL